MAGRFVFRDREKFGPYSTDDIRAFVSEGSVSSTDLVREENSSDWKTVQSVLEHGDVADSKVSAPATSTDPRSQTAPTDRFVFRDREKYGPYDLSDIRSFVSEGSVGLGDLVRHENSQDWITVEALLHPNSHRSSQHLQPMPVARVEPPRPVHIAEVKPKPERTAGNALTWPFHQGWRIVHLWIPLGAAVVLAFGTLMPLSLAVPPYLVLFILCVFLVIGWMLEVVRRRVAKSADLLPSALQLGRMLKDGFWVSVMYMVYFTLPLWILKNIVQLQWTLGLWDLWDWFRAVRHHQMHDSVWRELARILVVISSQAAAPLIYVLVITPVFVALELHYAQTGKLRSLFNVFGSVLAVFRNMGSFLTFFLLASLTRVGLIFLIMLSAVMTGPGVVPASIFLITIQFWIIAFLAGNLAADVKANPAA